MIVWDRGTWTPAHTDDPAAAIAAGELHFDLVGEKLAGRFALIRRNRKDSAKEQWLLVHKNDEHAGTAGPPTTTRARCSADGRTTRSPPLRTRCGRAASRPPRPRSAWARAAPGSRRPTTSWPLSTRMRRNGPWTVAGHDVKLTNLDKVLFPGRDGEPPVTKREIGAPLRDASRRCCCPTWPAGR